MAPWVNDESKGPLDSSSDTNFVKSLVAGIIYGSFFGIGCIVLGAYVRGRKLKELLSSESAEATGKIYEMESMMGVKEQMVYYIRVTFQATRSDGLSFTISGQANVDESVYSKYREGMSIPMRYIPDDVELCMLADSLTCNLANLATLKPEPTNSQPYKFPGIVAACGFVIMIVLIVCTAGMNILNSFVSILSAMTIVALLFFCGYRCFGKCLISHHFFILSCEEDGNSSSSSNE
jgi:hypothetical protein